MTGRTVRQVVNNLECEFPGMRSQLCDDEEDDLLPGIAVIVDGEVSQLGLLERVHEDSEIHFLPALGGGA
ncbi:MAG: MoaD/ThiS family protein [Candidatus Tectomicrobia bacterium]|nr:MoaD/ThiS family protein [Candidatus Tectomicrobia bacterium]